MERQIKPCMINGDKVALVCCSNGQDRSNREKLERLREVIEQIGLSPVFGSHIYAGTYGRSGSAKERADNLMDFYRDEKIKAIYDISGGDLANEILPFLDYDVIARSPKAFWGYSDLTVVINAIYAKTRRVSILYQIRNLIYEDAREQMQNFSRSVMRDTMDLYNFSYTFFQKKEMKGIMVGGNIRCLLKLAGTEYWPEMRGKILLLEAMSSSAPQVITYLSQLQQMGVFREISGILLGTFSGLCGAGKEPVLAAELVRQCAGEDIPIAYTREIGHGADSKAVRIGQMYHLVKR